MKRFQKQARVVTALTCLTAAFLFSVQFSDRGVQFNLKNSVGAGKDKDAATYDLSALKILNRVLLQVKDNYVEPERIKPARMLVSALDEIQNTIAEVVVDYDRSSPDHIPDVVKVSVRNESKEFKVKEIQSLWEMSFKLKDVFGFIQATLGQDDQIKYQDVEYAAINGLLSTLDPHSTLLPPASFEDMQTQTGGKFGGLGIVIGLRDGQLTVISPIQGTPAARAGIKARDQITRIGEESTVNMSLTDAVGMMRGDPGTKIDIWVQRQGWTEPKKFVLERAIIKIESVSSQPLANKVAYIRIKNFQANTYADTKRQVDELRAKMGGVQGLVLDLRDNPGGLLDQAVRLSDMFIDEGTLVSTVGQGNKMRDNKLAVASGTEPKYPIVVLVSPGSASASEIVAGALRNNNRAIIVGDTTFGKGSVQVLYEFPDRSALKLTIAQYLTPGDVSIQGRGVSPDLRVMPVTIDKNNVDMFISNTVMREGDLAEALTNERTNRAEDNARLVRYFKKKTKKDDEEFIDPDEFKEDFEIKLAQRLLVASSGEWKTPDMMRSIEKELGKVDAQEMGLIGAELKKLGVVWAEGPSPKQNPTLDLKVTSESPTNEVKAGDKLKLTATLTNKGSEPLYQVKAITDADYNVFNDKEFVFGKLDPGQSASWTVELQTPRDAANREDLIKFVISDAHKNLTETPPTAVVRTVAQPRPHFAFYYDILDESGDGVLQAGEEVKLKVWVENNGDADSGETQIYLKNGSGESIYLQSGRAKVPKITAAKNEAVEFSFQVKKAPKEGDVFNFEVDVYDATYREYTQAKLKIPYSAKAASLSPARGAASLKRAGVTARVGAHPNAEGAALLDANASLPVLSSTKDGWVKVNLGNRAAWLLESDVTLNAQAPAQPSGIKRLIAFQAPLMQLTPAQMMTSADKVALSGVVSDPTGVKDYYIFVYGRQNATLQSRKVVYTKTSGERTDIKATIPLFPGMNRIAVFARDESGMLASESAYVYRK